MKKILFALAAAAMVLGAASCQKEDLGKIDTAKAVGTPLDVITVVCGADTRLAIDGETLTPAFEADDEIFGWDYNGISYTYKCTAVDEATGIATFGRISEQGPSIRIGTLVNLIYAPGSKAEDIADDALVVNLSKQGETLPVVMSGSGVVDSEGNCQVVFTNNVAIVEVKDALFPWAAEGEEFAVEFYGKYNSLKFELDEDGALAVKPATEADGWIANSVKSKADAESRISAKFAVPADGSDVLVSIKAKASDGSAYAFSAGEKKISSGKYINVPGKVFTPQYVAHINQKGYLLLSDAIEAANASKEDVTITMLESIEADSGMDVNNAAGAKVTLDLNGKTLTYNGSKRIRVTGKNTELIIIDSSEGKTGEIIQVANDKGAISHYTGTLTIAGGKISNVSTTTVNTVNLSGGILNVTGGKITLDKESKSIISASAGTLNVTGGEIYSTAPKAPGISMSGTVVVNVKDAGKITSASNAVSASAGTLNIEGGYFKSGAAAAVVYKSKDDAVFNIGGGYYSKAVTASYLTGSGYLCVKNTDPETKEAYPYKVAVPLTIAVGSGDPVVCESVEAAMAIANEAGEACTITLYESFEIKANAAVKNQYGVTLELNGETLTQTGTSGRIAPDEGGILIIKDSEGGGVITQTSKASSTFNLVAGELIIESGTITKPEGSTGNTITVNGGKLTVKGGSISNDATQDNDNIRNRATIAASNGMVTVSGGAITSDGGCTIAISGTGELNVSGGEIQANGSLGNALYLGAGSTSINVSGGLIYSQTKAAVNITSNSAHQLIFSGDCSVTAESSNALFSNSTATEPNSKVTVNDGKFKCPGKSVFSVLSTSTTKTEYVINGCIYNGTVSASRLDAFHKSVDNNDSATKADYPQRIVENIPVTLKIGGGSLMPFASVEAAVTEANKDANKTTECTITLMESVTAGAAANVENTAGVTLDLNGKTLTQNGTTRIGVAANGKLIIDDGSSDHSGAVTQSTGNAFAVSAGTLVIKGGNISTSAVNNAISISGGSVEINGENVSITSPNVNSGNAATSVVKLGSGSLKLAEGTVGSGTNSGDNGNFTGVSVANGTFTMEGGRIYARWYAIIFSGTSGTGTASISGGLLATTVNNWSLFRFQDGSINALTIDGGGFTVQETDGKGKLFAGKSTGASVPSSANVIINPGCYLSKNPIGTNGITAANVNGSIIPGSYNYDGKSFNFKVE